MPHVPTHCGASPVSHVPLVLHVCLQLLSDAELAAVSRFLHLTSLTLNSEDGVMPGRCSLSLNLNLEGLLMLHQSTRGHG